MPRRLPTSPLLAAICLVAFAPASLPAAPAAESQVSINQIYLEVSALSTLYDLYATPEQLKALQSIAADTASKKPLDPSPRLGRPYRSALAALRDAYVKNDDDEIGDCQERVDNLEEKMDHPPDPAVEVTDAARRKVGDALKLFTPTQVAEYVAARSDEAPDPAATLIDALDAAPGQADKAFATLRKQTTDELPDLLADGSQQRQAVADQIGALLDRAHGLSADDYKSHRADLAKEAHALADPADPTAVVSRWVRRDVAELLSNPQLPAALAARLK